MQSGLYIARVTGSKGKDVLGIDVERGFVIYDRVEIVFNCNVACLLGCQDWLSALDTLIGLRAERW